jgi:hypothetical protein
MARVYNLDTQAAKDANTGGKRITETGKYMGTVTAAFYEKNPKGTESVNLMFIADNGQEVGPLNLYTHNSSGETLAGYKQLNALMTCAKVKVLNWKQEAIELYDYDQKVMVSKQKECAIELKGKKLGLVLQQEEYLKQNGEVGERIIIAAPFEYGTELMAAEILSKQTKASSLGGFMAFIAKNPVRKLRNQPAQSTSYQSGPMTEEPHYEFDDIPFD